MKFSMKSLFHQPSSAAHRVAMNTGFLYAKMGITVFISLYTTRLILAALGKSDYGTFSIVGGAILMLGFIQTTMASATQRFMSYTAGEGNKEKQKKIFNISIILHFLIAILTAIILFIAGYLFFDGFLNISPVLNIPPDRIFAARMIYYFMIISTMFTFLTVPYDAVINAHENMLYYAIVGVIESVLKLSIAIVVVHTLADKLIIYGVLMAGLSILVMIIMRVYCHRNYEECVFAPRKYFDQSLMKEMTGFAGWNFLTTSSSMIGQYGLGVVLNSFFGTTLNAAQGVANTLCGQLQVFSNTMSKALTPVIVKKAGVGELQMMLQASMTGCKISFFLLAFFATPFLVDAYYVMSIWLKDVPEWAVIFFQFQLCRSLIEAITGYLGATISAQGDIAKYSQVLSVINIIPLAATAVLFYLGFPPYSMYIVWIFCWGVLNGAIRVIFAKIKCKLSIRVYFKEVFVPCLILFGIACGITLIPYFLMSEDFIRFLCIAACSTIAFLLLFWFVFLDFREKQAMMSFIVLIKNKFVKSNHHQ